MVPISKVALPPVLKRSSANSAPGEAAQLAALLALGAALLEAGRIAELQGFRHDAGEIAAIVIEIAERRLEGQLRRRNEILLAQRDAIGAELARHVLDQPLDDVDRLGPAGAAIRRGRGLVREGHGQMRIARRNIVDADHRAEAAEGREQIAVGGEIGADIADEPRAQAEEFMILIERQLGLGDDVAAMLVGEQHLAALAAPFDRAAELARRHQGQAMLDILPALGAEAATDIAGDDANLRFRDLEHIAGQHVANAMRVLHIGMQGEALVIRIVSADRTARLHILRMDAADDVFALDDMRGARESRVGRGLVAGLEDMADVVGVLVPDARRAGLHRVLGIDDRGQLLVIDLDQLGRVFRRGQTLGDHHRHRIADKAHLAAREARLRPRERRRAVGAFPRQRQPRGAELLRRDIRLGEHAEHAGRGFRGARVDA
jgi:hypothetical protein